MFFSPVLQHFEMLQNLYLKKKKNPVSWNLPLLGKLSHPTRKTQPSQYINNHSRRDRNREEKALNPKLPRMDRILRRILNVIKPAYIMQQCGLCGIDLWSPKLGACTPKGYARQPTGVQKDSNRTSVVFNL